MKTWISCAGLILISSAHLTLTAGQAVPLPAAFTAAQASAGQASYQADCASCHVADLAGRNEAPALAGSNFMNTWRGRTTRDLVEYMQATMPPGRPSLAPDDYVNITAFILQANGATAGTQPLLASATTAIGSIATGQRAAAAPGSPAAAPGAGAPARPAGPPPPRGLSVAGEVKSTRLNSSHP